jgi:hypothetical protein
LSYFATHKQLLVASQGSAQVKLRKANPPGPGAFFEQQVSYQEPREHEEHHDAEPPTVELEGFGQETLLGPVLVSLRRVSQND